MKEPETYKRWFEQTEKIRKGLLSRPDLLKQYSIWIEPSEQNAIYQGKNILDMLTGTCLFLSNLDFIPGTGNMNLVYILRKVQKETGLDLGVCEFLDDRIEKFYKEMSRPQQVYFDDLKKENQSLTPRCLANKDILVGDLSVCIPPQRCRCPHRMAKLLKRSRKND